MKYLQYLISIETFKRPQKVRVVHCTKLERSSKDKHSSLLGPFVSCKEHEIFATPHFHCNFIKALPSQSVALHQARKAFQGQTLQFIGSICKLQRKKYLQHFIFFVTFEWAQKVRVLHCTRLERFSKDKHSSLFGVL